MSEHGYFVRFPVIQYGNNSIVDITKRTAMIETVSNNPYIFYPYEISQEERPDQFSDRYFGDSYKSWIIYVSNKIVDPYYEWYLTENQFNGVLIKKYGSVKNAYQKIKFYRNDYFNSTNMTISNFDALPPNLQKYWKPIYGNNNKISEYTRKQDDHKLTTNKIISYTVANTSFMKNEICNIKFNNAYSGQGQVLFSANNNLKIQHVSGTYLANSTVTISAGSYIYGTESKVNTHFSTTSLVVNNIPQGEEMYWAPITYADSEKEINEYNKSVRIIDKRLTDTVSDNLTELMKV
jgi:hypothetical protein